MGKRKVVITDMIKNTLYGRKEFVHPIHLKVKEKEKENGSLKGCCFSDELYDMLTEKQEQMNCLINNEDIIIRVLLLMDQLAMSGIEINYSCDELIEKFNGDYERISDYLSNKYNLSI